METKETFKEQLREIIDGLALSTAKMIEFKKSINSPIVVSRDGEVVHVNPHEFQMSQEKS